MTTYLIRQVSTDSVLKSSISNTNSITATVTPTDLLPATNSNQRQAVSVENHSDQIAFIEIGTAVSSPASEANHSYLIPANKVVLLSPCPAGALNARLELGSGKLIAIEFLQ